MLEEVKKMAETESRNVGSISQRLTIKVFNFEKIKKKERQTNNKNPENLLRKIGGLKNCKDLKYSNFEPLYALWKDYYKKLIDSMNLHIDERILKADYHGCLLRVADSPNQSQIGLYGIVVHETKSTFQMITRENALIIIPKQDVTFHFVLSNQVFTLFGNGFLKRPHLRGKKMKPTNIPFLL